MDHLFSQAERLANLQTERLAKSANAQTCPPVRTLGRTLRSVKAFRAILLTGAAAFFAGPMVPSAFAATSPTATVLTVSAASVAYKTSITLTATVTSNGNAVTSGLVLFCDAGAAVCENNSALGLVQLTSPAATASLKLGSGALGAHSYKAVYRANNLYDASRSNNVTYTVTGTYPTSTTIASSGSVGSYTLSSTVVGVGSLTNGPTGNVSFLDASAGNNVLGTQPLGPAVLSNAFVQAPNSPFDIATKATQQRSVALASAYLNADNNLDIVTGDALQTVTVLLGKGDGTFQPKVNYAGCPTGLASKILLADFNRDGNTDIALGCSDGNGGSLTILLGNGDGTFRAAVAYTAGDVAGIAIGDFNGDGIFDIAVSNHLQRNIMIFTGKGDGTFSAGATVISPTADLRDIVVADFNTDGKDDLLYAISSSARGSALSDLYLATGKGDGTFQTPALIASQVGEFLATGDTNGDSFPDVISTTITGTPPNIGPSLFVLIGKGDGTFKPTVTYISDIPSDPHLADVNGDGKPDIIAGGSSGVLVYQGKGDGTFQPYTEPSIGQFSLTYAVNAGDFNNDGNADLIGTDADTPRAAVSLSEVRQTATSGALTGVALYPLGSGTHNVDATYSSDTLYFTSVSPTVPLLAAPTPTVLTLSVVPASATVFGQQVTLTATLNPYAVGPPNTTTDGETVKFYNGTVQLGTGILSKGVATLVTSKLPVGSDAVTAIFPGDANYLTSTSSTVNLTVTAILLSSSVNPSVVGQSVTFTATLAPGLTGTVTFKEGANTLGTVNITGSTASITTATLALGLHDITGIYNGDGAHKATTSPILTQEVDKATPKVSVTTSGPSNFGDPVTFTVSLPPGTTGTITLSSGSLALGSGPVDSSGKYIVVTSALPVGSDSILATYSGDTNNNSASGTVTQAVGKASPSVKVTTSGPSTYGDAVTITATVPAGATGTITLTSGGLALGSGTVTSAGTVTITTSVLPVGASDPILASYGGDGNYNAASGTTTQTVSKITSTLAVTTSGPSTYAAPVTITATISPNSSTGTVTFTSGALALGSGTVSPTGTVTITTTALPVGASDPILASYSGDSNTSPATGSTTQTVNKISPTVSVSTSGPSIYGDVVTITSTVPTGATGTIVLTSGSLSLGSGTVSATGTVTITTSALPVGASDPILASYSGDGNYDSATGSTTQKVDKTTTIVTVTTSGPSNYGDLVTITAKVTPGVTGTITITSGGLNLGSGTVSSAGTVTITTAALPVGASDPILATYSGDGTTNAATGATTQSVSKNTVAVTVISSGPTVYGEAVTLTAKVPAGVTGTIAMTSGGLTLGSGTVSATGTVTITTTALPVGDDTILASYSGDGNTNSATGTMSQKVSKSTPTVTVTSSGPSTYGAPVTLTSTVSPASSGTVTFTSGGLTLGSGTVSATGIVTITTTALPVGDDTILASYSGDGNTNPATGTMSQKVSKATSTVTVTTSGPSTYGAPVTITTTVPSGLTGTVTVTSSGVTLGSGTIAPDGTVTITTSVLPVGASDPILASYSGDGNDNPATGTTTQTVNKTTPPITVTTSGPSTYGTPVTITTTVPPGSTGTVTVTSGGVTLGSGPVTPGGTVTITTSALPVGASDPILSTYSGDTTTNGGTGSTTQTVNKTTPPITVTTSGPSTYGTPVTITTTVPPGSTGTVTVTSGGVTLGTGTVTPGGTVTITTSALPVGATDPVVSTYSGDTTTNGGTASTSQTVTKVNPASNLTSSQNPSTIGSPVTFTDTLPTSATGIVTFTSGTTLLGTSTIINGVATVTFSTLPSGSDLITATYNGDGNNGLSVATLTQTVDVGTPAITVTTSGPSTYGSSVTITTTLPPGTTGTVTVTSGGTTLGSGPVSSSGTFTLTSTTLPVGSDPILATYGGNATNNPASGSTTQTVSKNTPSLPAPVTAPTADTGTPVTITETVPAGVAGPVSFYNGPTLLGTAPIVNGIATLTVPSLPTGSDSITASTPADTNNNAAVSPATSVNVTKTTPILTPPVVSSPNPPAGTPVTITQTVPPGVTGIVTIYDGGTPIGTAPIVNGTATLTVPTLPVGSHPITVVTPAGPANNPATSPVTVVTVAKGVGTIAVLSSANPSSLGQAVTFTASVNAGATGTVTFLDGAVVLGVSPVSPSAIATFTTSSLTIGSHAITASFAGDVNFSSALSPVLLQVIGKLPSAVTVTQDTTAQLYKSTVTFTANVTTTAPTPTGTVTFYDGATILGTAPLSTNGGILVSFSTKGNAAFTTSSLAAGTHQITAVYSGDVGFMTSSSAPLPNIVADFTNVAKGVTTQNLFPGDTTSYTFVLTPVGAPTFLADTPLSISGLPVGTSYSFSPAVIAAGSGATTVTLSLTTNKALVASNKLPVRPASELPDSRRPALPIALGMLGLLGIGTIRRHRRQMPRLLLLLFFAAASLLPIAALSGCAGGYFTLNPTTYVIQVTGTQGALQHTATTTLIVQ